MSKRILFAGESWMSFTTHVKGFDTFNTSVYETGEKWLKAALEDGGYEVVFLPNHLAPTNFPFTLEELKAYDCVILSDIGANTLLLSPDTFSRSIPTANRCTLIKDYVMDGGALLMVGGYMTFSGIDGKGKWGQNAVQEVLPVRVLDVDDRMEHPEGVTPIVVGSHEGTDMLKGEWPHFLGYNKTIAKEDAIVPVTIDNDPLIAFGTYGKGKSAVFTSDCAPHWGPPEFLNWKNYDPMWQGIMNWLTSK